jgi:UDP-2,3-diacylglucosamine pyrophosphatase LpxH
VSESYIVISDIHLGSKECNQEEFCDFLIWTKGLSNNSFAFEYNNRKITINKPNKIILLGDIVDLWNPKGGDNCNIIKDSILPFKLLAEIDCPKIYIAGNHDETLGGLEDSKFINGTQFLFCKNCYPENGISIGKHKYFFLHGHQYDRTQKLVKLVDKFWNPIEWFQDAFHIRFAKEYWELNFGVFLLLLSTGYLLWSEYLRESFAFTVLWALFTGFFAFNSIPGIVANTQGSIYDAAKPKNLTAERVIKEKYYDKNGEPSDVDTIIFGHTHFASSYSLKTESHDVLFINSGCWIEQDRVINGKTKNVNTFVYINDDGAFLLKWENNKVVCLETFE